MLVYGFVRAAQNDARRASCSATCALRPTYAGNNRTAPDFELSDAKGKPVRLSSLRGKTVVLSFWTRTCGPCLEEMPALVELTKLANARNDFVVLTVSVDSGPDAVRDALSAALGPGDHEIAITFDPESKIVGERYGTKLFPETWIIDPNGVIVARFDGRRDWSSSLALELIERASQPMRCPITFDRGVPRGEGADICESD